MLHPESRPNRRNIGKSSLLFCAAILCAGLKAEAKYIVIPVEFQDVKLQGNPSSFIESAGSFLSGQLHFPVDFELFPKVCLEHKREYYGANSSDRNDSRICEAVFEACRKSNDIIDYSKFDADNDHKVDLVVMLTAGENEADGGIPDSIWPAFDKLSARNMVLLLDGKLADNYLVIPEYGPAGPFTDLGTFAHEFCHQIGMQDLYDTDGEYSGGKSEGLAGTSLMDEGCRTGDRTSPPDIDAVCLSTLGLGQEEQLQEGHYSLEPIREQGRYLIYSVDRESYLIENRKIPGREQTLNIYHIDRSSNNAGHSQYYSRDLTAAERWELNEVNCNPGYECARLLSGEEEMKLHNGSPLPFVITDIKDGSDGMIEFDVIRPIKMVAETAFQMGFLLEWEIDGRVGNFDTCTISWHEGEKKRISSVSGKGNAFRFNISGLTPHTLYNYTVSVSDGKVSYSYTGSVTTKYYRPGNIPFIYMRSSGRRSDGSFERGSILPLQMVNVNDGDSIEWFWNNSAISDGNGTITLLSSGLLKAVVHEDGGRVFIFTKEVIVR